MRRRLREDSRTDAALARVADRVRQWLDNRLESDGLDIARLYQSSRDELLSRIRDVYMGYLGDEPTYVRARLSGALGQINTAIDSSVNDLADYIGQSSTSMITTLLADQPSLLNRVYGSYLGTQVEDLPYLSQRVLDEVTTQVVGGGTFFDHAFNWTERLRNDVRNTTRSALVNGQSFDELRANMQRVFGVDKLGEPRYNAYGAVKIYKNAARRAWNNLMSDTAENAGALEVWWANLDEDCTPGCAANHGFAINELGDLPPMHVNCRCTLAIMPAETDLGVYQAQGLAWLQRHGLSRNAARALEAMRESSRSVDPDYQRQPIEVRVPRDVYERWPAMRTVRLPVARLYAVRCVGEDEALTIARGQHPSEAPWSTSREFAQAVGRALGLREAFDPEQHPRDDHGRASHVALCEGMAIDWDAAKHPRGEHGQFAPTGSAHVSVWAANRDASVQGAWIAAGKLADRIDVQALAFTEIDAHDGKRASEMVQSTIAALPKQHLEDVLSHWPMYHIVLSYVSDPHNQLAGMRTSTIEDSLFLYMHQINASHMSLPATVSHEFAHALDAAHGFALSSKLQQAAPDERVTPYASTNAKEAFAEAYSMYASTLGRMYMQRAFPKTYTEMVNLFLHAQRESVRESIGNPHLVIAHPSEPSDTIHHEQVAAVVRLSDGRVLYAREPFHGDSVYTRVAVYCPVEGDRLWAVRGRGLPFWSLPGGHIDEGESPHDAAAREMREETGEHVEIVRYLGALHRPWSTTHVYQARSSKHGTDEVSTPEEIDAAAMIRIADLDETERAWLQQRVKLGEAFDPNQPRGEHGRWTSDSVHEYGNALGAKHGADVSLYLTHSGDLHLQHIAVPKAQRGQGVGSHVMNELTQFADRHGLRVTLDPAVRDEHMGTTSRARLIKYYRRFGFVPNKGRHTDYSISAGMYRNPTARASEAVIPFDPAKHPRGEHGKFASTGSEGKEHVITTLEMAGYEYNHSIEGPAGEVLQYTHPSYEHEFYVHPDGAFALKEPAGNFVTGNPNEIETAIDHAVKSAEDTGAIKADLTKYASTTPPQPTIQPKTTDRPGVIGKSSDGPLSGSRIPENKIKPTDPAYQTGQSVDNGKALVGKLQDQLGSKSFIGNSVQTFKGDWDASSSTTGGTLMRTAASEVWGGRIWKNSTAYDTPDAALNRLYQVTGSNVFKSDATKIKQDLVTYAKAQYGLTQKLLAQDYGGAAKRGKAAELGKMKNTAITLYRGVSSSELPDAAGWRAGDRVRFVTGSLSSFTTDRKTADSFGSHTVKIRVRPQSIFSYYRTGAGTTYEKEHIVLGDKTQFFADVVRSPGYKLAQRPTRRRVNTNVIIDLDSSQINDDWMKHVRQAGLRLTTESKRKRSKRGK